MGDFEASYVPTLNDWDRLDERFRIPASLFDAIPAYRDFGFAVFKLRASHRKPWFGFLGLNYVTQTIHPMAFDFPRANRDRIFFPTVHVHDGKVHPMATFDHTLYCQTGDATKNLADWEESAGTARKFMDLGKARGVVQADGPCYKKDIWGKHRNDDIWL